MPAKRYVPTLTEEERVQLRGIVQTGREKAFRRRAQIYLQLDARARANECGNGRAAGMAPTPVARARRNCQRQGLAAKSQGAPSMHNAQQMGPFGLSQSDNIAFGRHD